MGGSLGLILQRDQFWNSPLQQSELRQPLKRSGRIGLRQHGQQFISDSLRRDTCEPLAISLDLRRGIGRQ